MGVIVFSCLLIVCTHQVKMAAWDGPIKSHGQWSRRHSRAKWARYHLNSLLWKKHSVDLWILLVVCVGGWLLRDSMGTVGWLQSDGLLIHSAQHAWAAVLFALPCLCIKKLPCWCSKKKKNNTPAIFNLLQANTTGFSSKVNLISVFLLSFGSGIIWFPSVIPLVLSSRCPPVFLFF